jgi:hypothetical protein
MIMLLLSLVDGLSAISFINISTTLVSGYRGRSFEICAGSNTDYNRAHGVATIVSARALV